ncbi:hypothetical protein LINPERPRIM_LOCUS39568, partial [Linum perenne]
PFFRRSKYLVHLILIHQQPFVRVRNRRDLVHPLPVRRNVGAVEEVTAEQEEQSCEGNHGSVPYDVVRNHGADEHDEGVGRKEGDVEDEQEVVEGAAEL